MLLICSDSESKEVIKTSLDSLFSNCCIIESDSFSDGFRFTQKEVFDLIFLNSGLVAIDELEKIKRLKMNLARSKVTIIVISAKQSIESASSFLIPALTILPLSRKLPLVEF